MQAILFLIAAVGCQPRKPPAIKIIAASHIGDSGAYAWGYVTGVPPGEYGVAVYILVRGNWVTKPYWSNPTTPLLGPLWFCDIVTGGVDEEATKIRAYLWKLSDGDPPRAYGEEKVYIDEDVPFDEIDRK